MLQRKYSEHVGAVAVTAATGTPSHNSTMINCIYSITGIAACNIGGVTIHRFAGIGFGLDSANELAKKIQRGFSAYERWKSTKVLIVDEGIDIQHPFNFCC
jgi:PIF1-like helicase